MAKAGLPVIEIRQTKGSNKIMTGMNTELLIDGKVMKGVRAVAFSVNARGLAETTVTFIGRFKTGNKTK